MSPDRGSLRFARLAREHYKYARKCPLAEATVPLFAPFINKLASRMSSDVDSQPKELPLEERAYAEALDYLYGRINYEKIGNTPYTQGNYRLDRMRQLLEILGNPHQAYDIVHVAGTKGKGTTSTLLANCFQECGLRTGLYTSPHLLKLEERIQFQGAACSPQAIVELTNEVRGAARHLEENGVGRATFFEMTTAMSMLHFANCQAEAVVLEVGLGGRLDSTNVCSPVATVITSISLDHQAQLGDTIEAIAREKAGIIKPGIPLVCSARHPDARAAITEVATAQGVSCSLIDRDFTVQWQPLFPDGSSTQTSAELVLWSGKEAVLRRLGLGSVPPGDLSPSRWTTCMLGRHQADNIAAALTTIDSLTRRGWNLPIDKLQRSIARTQPRARLEIVDNSPLSIIDSAHNPASIQAGLEALDDHFVDHFVDHSPARPLTVVFAASRDKDWRQMLRLLLARAQRLILTAYHENPRALPVDELSAAANAEQLGYANSSNNESHSSVEVVSHPSQAWQRAREVTSTDGIVYATGSFFLAAEIIASLE